MAQAVVRMIKHGGATFIELPEVNFNGREILVRVFPTDNPANVAVECMKILKESISPTNIITPRQKIIKPN